MAHISITKPQIGQPSETEDPKTQTAFTVLETLLNGLLDETNIKAESLGEGVLTSAVKALLNAKSSGLAFVEKNEATFTAASGELVAMVKDASTLTLPSATANRIVGVYAGSATTAITVTVPGSEKIFGDFLGASGVSSIKLAGSQHVTLQATGSAWVITAGEPKRTQTYVEKTEAKATLEAGIEASGTRPALVVVRNTVEKFTVTVGGVTVGEAPAGSSVSFIVLPGQIYKVAFAAGTNAKTSTLLL